MKKVIVMYVIESNFLQSTAFQTVGQGLRPYLLAGHSVKSICDSIGTSDRFFSTGHEGIMSLKLE